MVEYNPLKWSVKGTKQYIAETSYDLLDPLYGEGGVLEPVTVIVDPDRAIIPEYVAPAIVEYVEPAVEKVEEYSQDAMDTFREASQDSYDALVDAKNQAVGFALILGLAYIATR